MAGKSGLTRQEKQARTRHALLDAAAELFTERGFRHVSLDEIAQRAGVTKGAVYSNFADKEELFAAVCMSRATGLDDNPFSESDVAFDEQMRALGLAIGEATLSEANFALAPLELEMAQLALRSERARAWVKSAFARSRLQMAALLKWGADGRDAELPPLPYEELATIMRATLHGLMQQRS